MGVGLIETGAIVTDEIGRNPIKMHLTEFDTSGRWLRGNFQAWRTRLAMNNIGHFFGRVKPI